MQTRFCMREDRPPLKIFPANEPLKVVAVHILGPLVASRLRNRFILLMTDRFSKVTRVGALRTLSYVLVALAYIESWVASYG